MAESLIIRFIESNSRSIIWQMAVDNRELLAGIMACGMVITDELNYETNYDIKSMEKVPIGLPSYLFEKSGENLVDYYLDCDEDISRYRIWQDINEELTNKQSCGVLDEGEYGIWLRSTKRFKYNLYRYNTPYFFQGILSICNTFQVDFRNYIHGLPFDHYGNKYVLGNYIMTRYEIAYDAPDLNDIEEEEKDDENIITILDKDY